MDSFTESILARARERQKLLETEKLGPLREVNTTKSVSQPNLSETTRACCNKEVAYSDTNLPSKFVDSKENNFQGNFLKSKTRISSECSSTKSPVNSPQRQKTLNIQNENFNMEIKVTSADNVRVEVEIEEHDEDEEHGAAGGLRQDAKNRLNRLGKLYAGDEDISSPIHKTESKFLADIDEKQQKPSVVEETPRKGFGLRKLADLAQNINQWEDEITPRKDMENEKTTPKKSWKPPAPQPPKDRSPPRVKQVERVKSPPRSSTKPKAPQPPTPKIDKADSTPKTDKVDSTPKQLKWDKTVLDTLESQGFTRTTSDTRLVYKYNSQAAQNDKTNNEKKEVKVANKKEETKIAAKAAIFERSNKDSPKNVKEKDPALLSVSERMALFEKNKGAALVPKAPFAMATPLKNVEKNKKTLAPGSPKPPHPPPPQPAHSEKQSEVVGAAVPQAIGIASKMAQLLENKATISQEQIENNVKEQRKKEMDLLLNRFHRNNQEAIEEVEEEEEEGEEEDEGSEEETNEQTQMIQHREKKVQIVSPPLEMRKSAGKRSSKTDSPKVAAVLSEVKRIKVSPKKAGRLYPSLSDIEGTATETENETRSPTPTPYSSHEGSYAESDEVNTSFGRDILEVVCKNQTPQKRRSIDYNSSSSGMSDILDDMDDYIDEALAFDEGNGPTPPKHLKASKPSDSFNYKNFSPQVKTSPPKSEFKSPMKSAIKTPRQSNEFPSYIVDGDDLLPLTHTVSFYRKQQNTASSNTTPVRQIIRNKLPEETNNENDETDAVNKKIKQLEQDITLQQMIISQTSRALTLCNCTPEFMGSTEQVEAERVLLVATNRRQAASMEIQRLKVENSLRPQSQHSRNSAVEKGTVTISNIVLPLKQKYVTALAAAGGKGHHVVCLIKCGEQVVPTQLVSTVVTNSKNPDLELRIPGTIKLNDIYSDFAIVFEVHCLQAQEEILPHEVKYHIKKNNKVTPKKNKDSRLAHPITESPAGPQAVRSSSFANMGYVVISFQAIRKKHWALNNTPSMSPLEGTVQMSICCELNCSVEHRGFLTMFDDVSGYGAWHRRWCLLKGHTLCYWKYPDDEKKMPPMDSISLKNCITKQVGPVSREICARMHTFLIEMERMAYPSDKDTLVMVRNGDKTIIRHLLSADTKEERIDWCNKFNSALAALNMFKQ